MDCADIGINGMTCALAIWFGAHHSIEARNGAIALFFGWVFYTLSWLPDGYTPTQIIYHGTGEKIKSPQLWAMMDCVVGLYIASLSIPIWSRLAIWLSFTIQVSFHILRLNDVFDFPTYSAILDKIFIIQIAVFLVLGWPNVRERLSDFADRGRNVFSPPKSTFRKAKVNRD